MRNNTGHPEGSVENQVSFVGYIWKNGSTTSSPSSVSEDTLSIYFVRRCTFIVTGNRPSLIQFLHFHGNSKTDSISARGENEFEDPDDQACNELNFKHTLPSKADFQDSRQIYNVYSQFQQENYTFSSLYDLIKFTRTQLY